MFSEAEADALKDGVRNTVWFVINGSVRNIIHELAHTRLFGKVVLINRKHIKTYICELNLFMHEGV